MTIFFHFACFCIYKGINSTVLKTLRNFRCTANLSFSNTENLSEVLGSNGDGVHFSSSKINFHCCRSSSPDQVRISEGGKSRLTLSQAYSIMNTGPSPLPLMKTSFSIPVMYKDKLIIERSQLELSALSPSINCSMISFPSSESVTSSPGVVINPSVIITESNVPLVSSFYQTASRSRFFLLIK